MKYEKLNFDWEADPNSSIPLIWVENGNLFVDFYLSYFDGKFEEGARAQIKFPNCSKYSFNSCNDEGYFRGQYRTNPDELPWGDFYKIIEGFDSNFPNPVVKMRENEDSDLHYIFFFRDNTLELLSKSYQFKIVENNHSQVIQLLLDILLRKIKKDTDFSNSEFVNYSNAREKVGNLIEGIRKEDIKVWDELGSLFSSNGTFYKLSESNGWMKECQGIVREFVVYKNKVV